MFVRFLIIAAVVLLLTGCPATAPIIQYRNVLVSPPDSLLQDCKVEEPPERQRYMQSDWPDKEKLLTENIRGHIKNGAVCNVDKASLRRWKVEQEQIYKDKK
jgi:hypothetical protein